jgi:hypothetical protein
MNVITITACLFKLNVAAFADPLRCLHEDPRYFFIKQRLSGLTGSTTR